MAEQSISYGIGLSDQQLNAMLNSDVPEIRQQAENYLSTAQQQQTEKPNILSRIGNFFGMSSAGAAEPDFNVITGANTTNQFPFKSMADMAAANELALNQIYSVPTQNNFGNTQSGFATNFPLQPVPVNTGITTTDAANQFKAEEPFIMSGGQKIYVSDVLGMQQAAEKGNVFERPQGILSQAKDFITQQLPKTLKGGLDTLVNFIPGMRFIRGLDKFDTLPYMDRKFIQSAMDQKNKAGSGIYVDPTSGLIKDVGGKNVRSLLGNYAETVDEEYDRYEKAINRAKDKYDVSWDGSKFIGANADIANKMNKVNINRFNYFKDQKQNKDAQQRQLLDKIAKQVAAGQTAKIGQSLHGGFKKSGDGGGFDTSAADKAGTSLGSGQFSPQTSKGRSGY